MADYVIDETTLTNLADAIRSKTGKTNDIAAEDMADEIINIPNKFKAVPGMCLSNICVNIDILHELGSNID